MTKIFAVAVVMLCVACGGATGQMGGGSGAGGGSASSGGGSGTPAAKPGFSLQFQGQNNVSPAGNPVTLIRSTRWVSLQSKASVEPYLAVDVLAKPAELVVGATFGCVRAASGSPDDTSVFLQGWFDGHSHCTNVLPNPMCSIEVTAVTETTVTVKATGTLVDQNDPAHPGAPFSATVTANTKTN